MDEIGRVTPLRVAILTEEDPFFVYEFFRAFLADGAYREVIDIRAIVIQHAFRDPLWALVKRMWGFWGPFDFLRVGLTFLSFKVIGRSCRSFFEKNGHAPRDVANVNSEAFVEELREMRLDVIVSVASPQIFKKNLLGVPSWGCINVHSGPLPRYRGMMPTFWQLLHGEERIGITVHTMSPEIDGGDILSQVFTDVDSSESLTELIKRTKRMGAESVLDTLKRIRDGNAERQPMNPEDSSYFSFPQPDDVRRFRAGGGRML